MDPPTVQSETYRDKSLIDVSLIVSLILVILIYLLFYLIYLQNFFCIRVLLAITQNAQESK